ncbi:MAG: MBL fold metallo-hydrolase [Victivallaceae bacterium]|nr:MBL fold metallo-hydrolase [Victivallaceae bacterium]
MAFIVKQLRVGGFDNNFSYLVSDDATGDAVIIDPCGDVAVIKAAVETLDNCCPRYILLTHGHCDHTSGVAEVKNFFPAPVMAHHACGFPGIEMLTEHRQLPFGSGFIECLYAPGHTADGIIYRLSDDSAIFTGDTLFVDWCGYCDAATMFKTMREVIMPLADSNIVYSGHDYGRASFAPLGEEKTGNRYLNTADFAEFTIRLKDL